MLQRLKQGFCSNMFVVQRKIQVKCCCTWTLGKGQIEDFKIRVWRRPHSVKSTDGVSSEEVSKRVESFRIQSKEEREN